MQRSVQTIFIITLVSFFAACGDQNVKPIRPNIPITKTIKSNPADAFLRTGQFDQAADLYQEQARSGDLAQRPTLLLKAADAWLRAKRYNDANRLLIEVDGNRLTPNERLHMQLMQAQVAIAFRQSDQALQILEFDPSADVDIDLRIQRRRLRAQAHQLTGDLLEQANELAKLDALLEDTEEKRRNQEAILQSLLKLTETALKFLQPPQSDPLAGWMELALITKTIPFEAQQIVQRLEQWRRIFPNHPVDPNLLENMQEKIKELSKPINQIALLLPQEGPFTNAASAFRDGFFAAHYTQQGRSPTIKVYNSSGTQSATALYQQAVAEGASFVVGPLDKKNVRTLYANEHIQTPVLALNYVDDTQALDNFYQFSLSPEDEARQAAEKAWAEGYQRALTLTPETKLGQRIVRAFQTRWEALGGLLLEAKTYSPDNRDFSEPIQALLNLDESEQRHQQIQQKLRGDIRFEPRRRQDADFIFIAAKPLQARIIRPQLLFHRAEDLPIFATSSVYSGANQPNRDQDLEGVYFCDIPWVLTEDSEALLSKDKLLEFWPNISEKYMRLYAMGIDAYSLVSQLPWLKANTGQTFAGKTGHLYLDDGLKIHRQLVWAQFVEGIPRTIGFAQNINANVAPLPTGADAPQPILVR